MPQVSQQPSRKAKNKKKDDNNIEPSTSSTASTSGTNNGNCQDHENTNNENDLADKQGFNLGISSWNFYNTIQLIYILLWIFI